MQLHLAWSHCDRHIQYFTNQNRQYGILEWTGQRGRGQVLGGDRTVVHVLGLIRIVGGHVFKSCTKSVGVLWLVRKVGDQIFRTYNLQLKKKQKQANKQANTQAKKVMLFYGVGASAPCTPTRSTFTSLLAIETLCFMVNSHAWMIPAPSLTSCGTVALFTIFN
jgi:hypothetical protein